VRYLVAGGLAVAAHGYLRFTKEVDIVIRLIPDNIDRTFAALSSLGYRPSVPITKEPNRPQDRADIEQLRARKDDDADK
jgi:hypothetical protein